MLAKNNTWNYIHNEEQIKFMEYLLAFTPESCAILPAVKENKG